MADIAYQHLTNKARKQCDKALGKHGIIYQATWADEVRSDKNYDYSYKWHYQNLKDSMTTEDLKQLLENPTAEGEHLFYAINLMTDRLKKNPSDAEALKFLVHFTGDLHQPMHLGRAEDLGGNKVEMNWFGKKPMYMRCGMDKLPKVKTCHTQNSVFICRTNSSREKRNSKIHGAAIGRSCVFGS